MIRRNTRARKIGALTIVVAFLMVIPLCFQWASTTPDIGKSGLGSENGIGTESTNGFESDMGKILPEDLSGPTSGGPPVPATPTEFLRPAFGLCPGAPPSDGGMERHPDSTVDESGNLHMVWQERIDGQFEICYSNQDGETEMGLGSDKNSAYRITNTQHDSVAPRIAIDPASGILYVVWKELVPFDVNYHGSEEMPPVSIALYTATSTWASENPLWTEMISLVDGTCSVRKFIVQDSHWTFDLKPGKPDWWTITLFVEPGERVKQPDLSQCTAHQLQPKKGTFDTDGDGIPDSDEVLGKMGNKTAWWNPDTDGDGLPDYQEFIHKFDPNFDDRKGPRYQEFLAVWAIYLDIDGDGISYSDEELDYPVTTEVAIYSHGATGSYRFWPKVSGTYNLVLRTQQRTHSSGGQGCEDVSVSVHITVNGIAKGVWTSPWPDTSPWMWTTDVVETVDLSADFTAVTAADATWVDIAVTFDPPGCGIQKLVTIRALAIDWLKLELVSDRSEVNYKDADDFMSQSQVGVSTEEMAIQLDPEQKDLLLELDSMVNHDFDPQVLNEAINAFSDYNIVLNYKIDETGLSEAYPDDMLSRSSWPEYSDSDESSLYLAAHRNSSLGAYVHVMNVRYVAGACGIAEQGDVGDPPEGSGVLLPDQMPIDGSCAGDTVFQKRLGLLLHEVGHALGAAHDKSSGGLVHPVIDPGGSDTCNHWNVMAYTYCASPLRVLTGYDNTDRRFGASEAIGFPRFSIETVDQFNFNNLLSVDVCNNIAELSIFV